MKLAKRQIVLGALVLALGAAVYLNWQFTDSVPMVEESSGDISVSENDVGDEIEEQNLGIAQLVNNSYVETTETVEDEIPVAITADDPLADARLSRQMVRDEALGILNDVLADTEADTETKKAAVEESSIIAQNMLKESTAENLIKAKGVEDVVVFINGDECSVIVSELEDYSLIIQEIIINQTGFAIDKIQIIESV